MSHFFFPLDNKKKILYVGTRNRFIASALPPFAGRYTGYLYGLMACARILCCVYVNDRRSIVKFPIPSTRHWFWLIIVSILIKRSLRVRFSEYIVLRRSMNFGSNCAIVFQPIECIAVWNRVNRSDLEEVFSVGKFEMSCSETCTGFIGFKLLGNPQKSQQHLIKSTHTPVHIIVNLTYLG